MQCSPLRQQRSHEIIEETTSFGHTVNVGLNAAACLITPKTGVYAGDVVVVVG